ncbi:DNA-binding MarR family transcriptional regulator [Saccharothrix tamanrassetensis]|uniref:DNA-binding MarR family transcriptional regulator n=1 Tax=Saccharothrix tamanrassetensis TaxID=1051531 RepID=A0A841CKP3_9PSEU|nr:MarR family transcriptional regulator [Saccharothrix tamanrassetensis]MBB5957640.1 DNA-binding MarR family transcriptional regulator [Saccharothrix tamanrassetensis]
MSVSATWSGLRALHNRINASLERALQRRFHFGMSEFTALSALHDSPEGELRMQELTEVVGLNQSSVSRLVARLEQSGLTTREICESDRRGVFSCITPAGREVYRTAAPFYEETLAAIFDEVGADSDLGPLLTRIRS